MDKYKNSATGGVSTVLDIYRRCAEKGTVYLPHVVEDLIDSLSSQVKCGNGTKVTIELHLGSIEAAIALLESLEGTWRESDPVRNASQPDYHFLHQTSGKSILKWI